MLLDDTAALLPIDVNVLLYPYRDSAPDHPSYQRWLQSVVPSDRAYFQRAPPSRVDCFRVADDQSQSASDTS